MTRSQAVAAAWVLAALFVAVSVPGLDTLSSNIDEGVYAQQAALVRDGQHPYADFFHHQTPLHLYALAGVTEVAGTSWFAHRAGSLLAVAIGGVALFAIASFAYAPPAALAAQILFYCAPLQHHGLLALPNGIMVSLSVIGAWAVLRSRSRIGVVGGGVALIGALLFKPLALPILIAIGLVVVALRDERWKALPLAVGCAIAGLGAWLAFHVASGGAFTELLWLQAGRFAEESGFAVMSHYGPFRSAAALRGAATAFDWNVAEHTLAFASGAPLNPNGWLVLVAVLALPWAARIDRRVALLAVGWGGLTVLFSLFVWEPIWSHYFVQYLPPLALLAVIPLDAAWREERFRASWIGLGAATVVGYAALGLATRPHDTEFYARARALEGSAPALLSFHPLVPLLAGAKPACGLIDPFNVYGNHTAAALSADDDFARFRSDLPAVLACLDADPAAHVVVESWFEWFREPALDAWLAEHPERVHEL